MWFITALLSGWVFDKNGDYDKLLLAVNILLISVLFIGATVRSSIEITQSRKGELTEEEMISVKPDVNVSIFNEAKFEYRLIDHRIKKYHISVENKNKNAVPIKDLRIKFFFRKIVDKVSKDPVSHTGDYTVKTVYGYLPQKDGRTKNLEEMATDSALSKHFSFNIESYKYGEEVLHKNVAILACETWPENTTFFGTAYVDFSKKLEPILEAPSKLGTFEGEYYYWIGKKKFRETIKGTIPWTDIDERLQYLFGMNPDRGTIDINIDSEVLFEDNKKKYDFLPYVESHSIKFHGWRDEDFSFKVLISNSFSNDVLLEFHQIEKILKNPNPVHQLRLVWGNGENKLYFDGILVDVYPKVEEPLGSKNYISKKDSDITDGYLFRELKKVGADQGRVGFQISKTDWLELDGKFIDNIFPHMIVGKLELYAYRDIDNAFKFLISNSFSNNVILKYDRIGYLKESKDHPIHFIEIAWGDNKNELFIDGLLVDKKQVTYNESNVSGVRGNGQ
jgi:hypothetical protein